MKTTTYIFLSISLVCSILFMVILYALSDKIVHYNNSFLRLYPHHPAIRANVLDIKYNSYYVAGATTDHIYLGNITAPLHLLVINTTLTDTQHIKLSIINIENLKFKRPQLKVDSPYFYLTDGSMPGIFRGRINNWHADRFMYDSAYFTQSVPVGPSSFAIRVISNLTHEHVLGKETSDTPHIKLVTGLLEKQIDGIFCTDGLLHYSKELRKLVYIYFYRNQYIVMDTNLNLSYRGHTIDTFSRAQIKVANITSKNSKTLSAPPLKVNNESCVSKNWLFVSSDLLAKNDEDIMFSQASIIDVYDLRNNSYEFSFYLYNYNKEKMKSFRVFNNRLIALFDHYVVTYNLQPQYFKVTENVSAHVNGNRNLASLLNPRK